VQVVGVVAQVHLLLVVVEMEQMDLVMAQVVVVADLPLAVEMVVMGATVDRGSW
jgi:hypothetical protein